MLPRVVARVADEVAADPAEVGPDRPQRPVGALELFGVCRFRFQCGTGGVREIKVLREGSPATFSVSIETEATFLLFQLGLVDRVIVLSMSASCSSATCPCDPTPRRREFAGNNFVTSNERLLPARWIL